jgi:anti-sigma regulatory factor (Ser/Thr protein kinase)
MVPASAEAVGPLRRALRRFARDHGAASEVQARVALAFSESCGLLVASATDEATAVLIVHAHHADGTLVLHVMSRGAKLRPVLQPAGAALALPLLLHVCDDVVIEHRDGAAGSVITMHFDLRAHDFGARGEPVTSAAGPRSMTPARPR